MTSAFVITIPRGIYYPIALRAIILTQTLIAIPGLNANITCNGIALIAVTVHVLNARLLM